MPRGNSSDPFGANNINWEGNRGDGGWGPDDASSRDSINMKANRKGLRGDIGIGKEKTVLDHDPIPSKQRAKASCADEYEPNSWFGSNGRQER